MSLWSRIQRQLGEIAGELLLDDTRTALEAGRELLDEDPAAAIPIAREILERDPNHALALSLLGAAHLELGQLQPAADAFERALSSDPDLPEALLGRGEAALALGRPEDAVTPYHRAVEQAGGDRRILAESYRGKGFGFRALGQDDKAIRELRKAVAENPDDAFSRAALGELLVRRGGGEEARRHLRRAAEHDTPPAMVGLALGQMALAEGDAESAAEHFEDAMVRAEVGRAFDTAPAPIHLGLGDALRELGELERAEASYEKALEQTLDLAPYRARVLARLGDLCAERDDPERALDHYRRSVEIEDRREVLERAILAAIRAGGTSASVELSNRLLALQPDHPRAMVARAMAMAADGQEGAARAVLEQALGSLEPLVHIALAELDLAAGSATTAAEQALMALRLEPRNPRARELLADARARELGAVLPETRDPVHVADAGDAALYQLANQLAGMLAAHPELATLAAEPAAAAADFDRPLLVTVMGEFSSGKSSFVNAFIGEDIAPTGITPTTATINVVKYGRERGGRIIYQDGRTESLGWSQLFDALRQLTGRAAAEIAQVEILLPLQELERVHIVDTPGLNSILPEHETVARDFISRADAVVWVFAAAQAGKKTERGALETIRDEGKRVLGVLNKVDQLGDGDALEVRRHVESELGELVEVVVPVSARRALEAKAAGGEPEGEFRELERELEERFFARARELKRQALSRRLGLSVTRARRALSVARERGGTQVDELRAAAAGIRDDLAAFLEATVDRERAAMQAATDELLRQAAREVLDLVRPRRLPFGSHQATPADREYLIGVLSSGYDQLIGGAEGRVLAELAAVAESARGRVPTHQGEIDRAIAEAGRWVSAQVFGRTSGYVRGYLRGGYVAEFFSRDLPKIELDEERIYHALHRTSPDLDAVVALPLARAGADALAGLAERLEHLADVADLHRFDLDVGIAGAIQRLDERRAELVGEASDGPAADPGSRSPAGETGDAGQRAGELQADPGDR